MSSHKLFHLNPTLPILVGEGVILAAELLVRVWATSQIFLFHSTVQLYLFSDLYTFSPMLNKNNTGNQSWRWGSTSRVSEITGGKEGEAGCSHSGASGLEKLPVLDRLSQAFWPLGTWRWRIRMWDLGAPFQLISFLGPTEQLVSPYPLPLSPSLSLSLLSSLSLRPFALQHSFHTQLLKVIQTQAPSSLWFHFLKETWFIQLSIAE